MRSAAGEDAPACSAAVSAEGPLPRLPCARRQSPVRPLLLFTTLVIAVARLPCGAARAEIGPPTLTSAYKCLSALRKTLRGKRHQVTPRSVMAAAALILGCSEELILGAWLLFPPCPDWRARSSVLFRSCGRVARRSVASAHHHLQLAPKLQEFSRGQIIERALRHLDTSQTRLLIGQRLARGVDPHTQIKLRVLVNRHQKCMRIAGKCLGDQFPDL